MAEPACDTSGQSTRPLHIEYEAALQDVEAALQDAEAEIQALDSIPS